MTAPTEREAIAQIIAQTDLRPETRRRAADRLIAERIAPLRAALTKAEGERDDFRLGVIAAQRDAGEQMAWGAFQKMRAETAEARASAAEALIAEAEKVLAKALSPRSPRPDIDAIRAILAKIQARAGDGA